MTRHEAVAMKLSIVTTLYKSEATVAEFIRRSSAAAAAITDSYEIVIVDDGSPDQALAIAVQLAGTDPHLKIVELSRNFGHHKALMTGLRHASGAYCFLIDSDLEEAPELLAEFWAKLHEQDMDVVYGFQASRPDGAIRALAGMIAYRLFDWLLSVRIPTNHLTVRLMRRSYVDSLLLHGETQLVIGGLWVITGYRQLGISVNKSRKGTTTYPFLRSWHIFLDSVTNFSAIPLVAIFYLGIAISAASGLFGLSLLLRWALGGIGVAGWVSVMLSVWFLGGLAILFIGVVGLYLSKIFVETKNRPLTIVRAIHQLTNKNLP
jgi:putative glycosyltransferase